MTVHEDIAARLGEWGERQADLRAVLVIGSRARTDVPADRWSDLDLVLITTDPRRYLERVDWLDALGEHWLTFLEPTATGGLTERRVLFEHALDVDFIVMRASAFAHMLEGGFPDEAVDVLSRGYRFLLDKDGVSGKIDVPARPERAKPSQAEFAHVVHDFWYHAVWVTKKLLRGELWTALGGHAHMQRNALLPMMVWHAKGRYGWGHETWHAGRYIEAWADRQTVRELGGVFAHYDAQDAERALLATMRLFARLASDTAERLGYAYPHEAESHVTNWVRQARASYASR